MAENALKIDDEWCKAAGEFFSEEGQQLQSYLDNYIKILNNINRSAICHGDVAQALENYISYANKMKNQIKEISDIAQRETEKFLSSIDEADQYIF
ncbi:hypothetical protein [Agathobacter sp.]